MNSKLPHGVAAALRDQPRVGERKPAPPGGETTTPLLPVCLLADFSSKPMPGSRTGIKPRADSHPRLLVLAVVPAVTGLGHQQGDDVAFGEAEQCAVVSCGVGEDGLDPGSSVLLQTCSHGAGAGQRAGLHWKTCQDFKPLPIFQDAGSSSLTSTRNHKLPPFIGTRAASHFENQIFCLEALLKLQAELQLRRLMSQRKHQLN